MILKLLILSYSVTATVQLHFVFSSYVYPNAGDLEIGNLTWKLECCMSNRKQFTLKIVAQKLDSLDSMYSMYSSGTCPGTNYRERKCLNSSLAVENGKHCKPAHSLRNTLSTHAVLFSLMNLYMLVLCIRNYKGLCKRYSL